MTEIAITTAMPKNGRPACKIDLEAMAKAVEDGLNQSQVAMACRMSRSTLKNRMRDNDAVAMIMNRSPGRPAVKIDVGVLGRAAAMGIPQKKVARILGVAPSTLAVHIAEDSEAGEAWRSNVPSPETLQSEGPAYERGERVIMALSGAMGARLKDRAAQDGVTRHAVVVRALRAYLTVKPMTTETEA